MQQLEYLIQVKVLYVCSTNISFTFKTFTFKPVLSFWKTFKKFFKWIIAYEAI
jgi:hypothetical protein